MYMCIEFTQARRNNVEVCLNWVYQHLRMLWNTFFSLAMRNSQFASKKKKVKKKRKRLWNHRQQSWYPLARSQKNVERILEFPTITVLQLGIPGSRGSSGWYWLENFLHFMQQNGYPPPGKSELQICIWCNRMSTFGCERRESRILGKDGIDQGLERWEVAASGIRH